MKAVERYNPSEGPLVSYASKYILFEILEELNTEGLVRVPSKVGKRLAKARRDDNIGEEEAEIEKIRNIFFTATYGSDESDENDEDTKHKKGLSKIKVRDIAYLDQTSAPDFYLVLDSLYTGLTEQERKLIEGTLLELEPVDLRASLGNVTKQRVSQIKNSSFAKLRDNVNVERT